MIMIKNDLLNNLPRKKQLWIFLFLPLAFFAVSLIARWKNGPYWLGMNSDPDYAYLLNSLNINQLKTPGHTDHPGTTIQVLGSIVIQITYLIQSWVNFDKLNIVEAVLKNPEFYLLTINTILLILITTILFFLGLIAFSFSQNIAFSLLLQLAPFLWTPLIQSTRVNPEPLLFLLTQFFVILLLFYLYSDVEKSPKFPLITGIVIGLGLATKVTFLPLGLVILLLPGWRQKGILLITSIITLFLATLPILSEYPRVVIWLTSIATHTSRYGRGDPGLVDLSTLPTTFWDLFGQDKIFFYLIGLSTLIFFITTFWFIWYRLKKANLQNSLNPSIFNKSYWLFSCILLIILVQLLLTLKHPAIHYLLPSMGLCSLLILVQIKIIEEIFSPVSKHLNAKNISLFIVGVYVVILINNAHSQISLIGQRNASYFSEIQTIRSLAKDKYSQCVHVKYYRSSDKESALKLGDDFAANQYAEALNHIYPNNVFYSLWSKKYYSFNKELNLNPISSKNCVVFQGSPLKEIDIIPEYLILRREMRLKPIFEGQEEAIYLVNKNN
jgi:hypothetical protein